MTALASNAAGDRPFEGNPMFATMHQGRLWLARTPAYPFSIWASATDDVFRFSHPGEAMSFEPGAPFCFQLERYPDNVITGMRVVAGGLVVSTAFFAWVISAGGAGIVSATNLQASAHHPDQFRHVD